MEYPEEMQKKLDDLIVLLTKNNKCLSNLNSSPDTISKILIHNCVCLQQIAISTIDINYLKISDNNPIRILVNNFKRTIETFQTMIRATLRWIDCIMFNSTKTIVKWSEEGESIRCQICNTHLREQRNKIILGEITNDTQIIMEVMGIKQQLEEDPLQGENSSLQNLLTEYSLNGRKVIQGQEAKADFYLEALLQQQNIKQEQLNQYLTHSGVPHHNISGQALLDSFLNEFTHKFKNQLTDTLKNQLKKITHSIKLQLAEEEEKEKEEKKQKQKEKEDQLQKLSKIQQPQTQTQRQSHKNYQQIEQQIRNIHQQRLTQYKNTVENQFLKNIQALKSSNLILDAKRKSLQLSLQRISNEKARLTQNIQMVKIQKQNLLQKLSTNLLSQTKALNSVYTQTEADYTKSKSNIKTKNTIDQKKSSNRFGQSISSLNLNTIEEPNNKKSIKKFNRNSQSSLSEISEIDQSVFYQIKRRQKKTIKPKTSLFMNLNRNKAQKQKQSIFKLNLQQSSCRLEEQNDHQSFLTIVQNPQLSHDHPQESQTVVEQEKIQSKDQRLITQCNFNKPKNEFNQKKRELTERKVTIKDRNFKISANSLKRPNKQLKKYKNSNSHVRFNPDSSNKSELKYQQTKTKIHYNSKNKYQKYFTLGDLQLFGGVNKNNSLNISKKLSIKVILNATEANNLQILIAHINQLKSFKNNLYTSVVSFLVQPYQTVSKGQVKPNIQINTMDLAQKVKDIAIFHKYKCGGICCKHLQNFYQKLGLPIPQN